MQIYQVIEKETHEVIKTFLRFEKALFFKNKLTARLHIEYIIVEYEVTE